jgi:hypothetical protein
VSEEKEPDWLAELTRGGEALQREAMRIVKAAEQFAASLSARPFTRRIVRAVDVGIRQLAAPEPVVHTVSGTANMTAAGTMTAVGNVVLVPMRIAGEGSVEEPDLIERNVGRILALVLLAFGTAGLLGVQGPDRATVDHYLTVIGVALTIAVLIWAGHK